MDKYVPYLIFIPVLIALVVCMTLAAMRRSPASRAPTSQACKTVHFTCKTDEEAAKFVDSFRNTLPGCTFIHYNDDHMRQIVSESGPRVLAAYDCVKPFAFKADIFRLCVLIDRGGLYLDANMRAKAKRLDEHIDFNSDHVFVRDVQWNKARLPYLNSLRFCDIALWQALIYSKYPGSPVLKYILHNTVERVLNPSKRVVDSFLHPKDAVLYFTGPIAFGEFAAEALDFPDWRSVQDTAELQILDFDGRNVTSNGVKVVGKTGSVKRMKQPEHYHAMFMEHGIEGLLCSTL